ncbi:MAG: ABC transporter ATP-binding protein [Firmicutes bacterium]|nr:ABC transporter ATP-binding protein [Bacillota bacterium]
MVGLDGYERSYPAQLSGGQQQRVALARSLVLRPKVLLLDEPLSNLDAKLRVRVREEIRDIQRRIGITTILVTHDQDEALSIADQVAILAHGKIQQVGPPDILYDAPCNQFVANFVGTMNWFRGHVRHSQVTVNGIAIPVDHPNNVEGDDLLLGVRPEDVRLTSDPRDPEASVVWLASRGHYQEAMLNTTAGAIRVFIPRRGSIPTATRYRFVRCHLFRDSGESA